jgi:DNA-binding transcriptional LysR family regulator
MADKFDFTSLELFVAVCELGSISQAAESKNITASAISKRITQLEVFAGTPLLARTSTGVAPTDVGVRLLEHARNVLYNRDILERDIGRSAGSLRGSVRIAANRSANAAFVPLAVASYLRNPKHCNIDVHIMEMSSHEVITRVKDGLAAVGVCWADTDLAGLDWTPGKRDNLSAVVPIDHPLAKKDHVAFVETLEYEHVGISSGGPVTNRLRQESVRAGKLLRYRVAAPTFDAMIRTVASGLVVAIMPAEIGLRYARDSEVAVIPLIDVWKDYRYAVCCRNRNGLQRPAAELFDHLAAWVE